MLQDRKYGLLAFFDLGHIFESCRRAHSETHTSNDSIFSASKHRSSTGIGSAQFRLKPPIRCDSASLNHPVVDAIRPHKQLVVHSPIEVIFVI